MAETMLLIACKQRAEYLTAATTVEIDAVDMARLDLKDGDAVRLHTSYGTTVVHCKGRKGARRE